MRVKLDKIFKSETPILPDVKIIETWAYYDGPLFGICDIHGQNFFFMDVIYDTWRHYSDNKSERLWAIYGVYDISVIKAKQIMGDSEPRNEWGPRIEGESDCIGIFWEYERIDQ